MPNIKNPIQTQKVRARPVREAEKRHRREMINTIHRYQEKGFSSEADLLMQMANGRLPCQMCSAKGMVNEIIFLKWADVKLEDIALTNSDGEYIGVKKVPATKLWRETYEQRQHVRLPCPYCAMTGFEILEPGLRLNAIKELFDRTTPKLRPMEIDDAAAAIPRLVDYRDDMPEEKKQVVDALIAYIKAEQAQEVAH